MHPASSPSSTHVWSVRERAQHLGVLDALVFRRLSGAAWAHLGGLGGGRDWVGVVDADTDGELSIAHLPSRVHGVHRFRHAHRSQVLGSYAARSGAVVRTSPDVVVILASPTGVLAPEADDQALCALAMTVSSVVDDITPAKRLADELEVLHAVRAVTTGAPQDLAGTLRHVLTVALDALGCDVGALCYASSGPTVLSSWPGVDPADPAVARAVLRLRQRAGATTLCVQDTTGHDLPGALSLAAGVRSLLVVPVPDEAGGVLVAAHTDADPRGFTALRQELARQVADAAGVVLHTAALREELRASAAEHASTARRDPLTRLGNRLAFDEALVAAQQQVDDGRHVTVLTVDLDGLKQVNDTYGHAAGDQLLRRCADVLRQHSRAEDVCVRLGGDEFAVLMPHAGDMAQHRLVTLSELLGGGDAGSGRVSGSVGMATAAPGTSVADAVREADSAMYAAKRARRARSWTSS
ncbi:sensor domain-containing diguanylate cyclase [Rhodococcus sp. X156]|uniref:GGDEF domain-containing protein n=1 Tax=Rhodococcus sp. X156 TaxID=2499145 RepID=UPI000FDB7F78|nr:sensor domain-containing diguanylate cyclase [Rhodococcus sp. X156]